MNLSFELGRQMVKQSAGFDINAILPYLLPALGGGALGALSGDKDTWLRNALLGAAAGGGGAYGLNRMGGVDGIAKYLSGALGGGGAKPPSASGVPLDGVTADRGGTPPTSKGVAPVDEVEIPSRPHATPQKVTGVDPTTQTLQQIQADKTRKAREQIAILQRQEEKFGPGSYQDLARRRGHPAALWDYMTKLPGQGAQGATELANSGYQAVADGVNAVGGAVAGQAADGANAVGRGVAGVTNKVLDVGQGIANVQDRALQGAGDAASAVGRKADNAFGNFTDFYFGRGDGN
jgi:hypothetical protein